MITREQNELLTRTGPSTSMGQLFRRYWLPILLSEELPAPDCPPERVTVVSERLVAFRDSAGRIGLVDEFCAHRRVSLWFGRNEELGLRCPYHGWKYDVTGQCVEVPSEPVASGFAQRVKLSTYPCLESGGVIWTYMGPADGEPAAPDVEWQDVAVSHRYVSKRWQESNYLQALEGALDGAHVSFLHSGALANEPMRKGSKGAQYQGKLRTDRRSFAGDAGLDRQRHHHGARSRLMRAARALGQDSAPPALDPGTHRVRAASLVRAADVQFKTIVAELLATKATVGSAHDTI